MASGSRDRARRLARAKLDRQLARRAAAERRSRRIKAGVGASLALVLIVFGAVWLFGGFESDPPEPAAESPCRWTPRTGEPDRDDVGLPPTEDIPTQGSRPMTLTLNGKPVIVEIDLAEATCAAASFAFLAEQRYFDGSKCTELNLTEGTLRCGDRKGTGLGGPAYSFANENVPLAADPAPTPANASPGPSPTPSATPPLYPRGTVAMIGTPPGSNGSQFVIFFQDFTPAQPDYSVVGRIAGTGLTVIDEIVKAGAVDNGAGQQVKPKNDVVLQSLTMGLQGAPGAATPSPTPSTVATTPAS